MKTLSLMLLVADILPVHLIVSNKGSQEFVIDASQIFAEYNGEYYPAFNLTQAAERVRGSSIGTTVATQAAVGALVVGAADLITQMQRSVELRRFYEIVRNAVRDVHRLRTAFHDTIGCAAGSLFADNACMADPYLLAVFR